MPIEASAAFKAYEASAAGATPEGLQLYLDALPVSKDIGASTIQTPAGAQGADVTGQGGAADGSDVQLTAEDREVCKRTRQDPEKFLAAKRADVVAKRAKASKNPGK